MLPPEFYRRQDFYLRPETRHRHVETERLPDGRSAGGLGSQWICRNEAARLEPHLYPGPRGSGCARREECRTLQRVFTGDDGEGAGLIVALRGKTSGT